MFCVSPFPRVDTGLRRALATLARRGRAAPAPASVVVRHPPGCSCGKCPPLEDAARTAAAPRPRAA